MRVRSVYGYGRITEMLPDGYARVEWDNGASWIESLHNLAAG